MSKRKSKLPENQNKNRENYLQAKVLFDFEHLAERGELLLYH